MNAEIKQKWVNALRSEKYRQGKFALCNNYRKYCCLGVLCDVIDNTKWKLDTDNGDYYYKDSNDEECFSSLSIDLLIKVGLDHSIQSNLIIMNDKQDKSFNEIADHIEKNL